MVWLKHYWSLALLVLLQGVFLFWPIVDLKASAAAYISPGEFALAGHWMLTGIDLLFGNLHWLLLLLLPWLMLASLYWGGAAEAGVRRKLYFLFLVVILAPGLAVGVLKSESGRAMPVDVEPFGGEHRFTAAFVPAAECPADCSFVSRTATSGFLLIALAWLFGDRRWLWAGIVVGLSVGLIQVAAGQHFLSDTLFALWIVYGACLLSAHLLLGHTRVASVPGSDSGVS